MGESGRVVQQIDGTATDAEKTTNLNEVPPVDSLEDTLLNHLQDKFGIRPSLDDSLAVLGVDSVSMAELTFDIEKQYGITVDDTMMYVDTVENLVEYIRERQRLMADRVT